MSSPEEDIVDGEVIETSIVKAPDTTPVPTTKWSWNKKKRVAFRMTLEGVSQTAIAKNLGVHRNTIRNWTRTREWLEELKARIQEKQLSTKLRRIGTMDTLVDSLTRKAQDIADSPIPVHPATASVFLKECREYVKTERDLYGENAKIAASGGPNGSMVNINIGGNDPSIPVNVDMGGQAFKDFVKQNTAQGETIDAASPQEVLIAKTRSMLAGTDVLDLLNEEDKYAERTEAARVDAKRR